jgi:hypothetical protein
MARILLNFLEPAPDLVALTFQNLHEPVAVENQRAGDALGLIIAIGNGHDIIECLYNGNITINIP